MFQRLCLSFQIVGEERKAAAGSRPGPEGVGEREEPGGNGKAGACGFSPAGPFHWSCIPLRDTW